MHFFSPRFRYLAAYQVLSNQNEPKAIWFDNSELKSLPEEVEDSDGVILIDDDRNDDSGSGGDDAHTFGSNGGLNEPSDNNSSSGEQKLHTCDICHSKLSSSYNLRRHLMIHTGWYTMAARTLSSVLGQGFLFIDSPFSCLSSF